ncbi:MAG TPA: hypothetical protein PKC69_04150 [Chitinophagaceae bacterium]|nr:hypothetical protein [Chitinophagaceae bacterium]
MLIRITLLTALLYFSALVNINAQHSKLQGPVSVPDIHTVYVYQKSNWDGSNASTIFLYVKDSSRLESFKWAPGYTKAALVTAIMDWQYFAVKYFSNHHLDTLCNRKLVAELKVANGKNSSVQVGDYKDSMLLADTYWHSYDFDMASLGFSWRGLKNKKENFHTLIADVVSQNGKPAFINKGNVDITYLGTEKINRKKCLKYKIDGPGLENKGGHIWINPKTSMIEQYKIELPDEDAFDNGMLHLKRTLKMTPQEWDVFICDKMKGK